MIPNHGTDTRVKPANSPRVSRQHGHHAAEVELIGGGHHGERLTVAMPPPATIRMTSPSRRRGFVVLSETYQRYDSIRRGGIVYYELCLTIAIKASTGDRIVLPGIGGVSR